MQHRRPVLAQTWGCGRQQIALNYSGISTFHSQQRGKGIGPGRVDAPVMQQTFHLQQSAGAGDFSSCKLGLWREREFFFFSFLLLSCTDEQPHRSGSLARFAFPGSAAGCGFQDQFVRNGSAEAHGEGIALIFHLPHFCCSDGTEPAPGCKALGAAPSPARCEPQRALGIAGGIAPTDEDAG